MPPAVSIEVLEAIVKEGPGDSDEQYKRYVRAQNAIRSRRRYENKAEWIAKRRKEIRQLRNEALSQVEQQRKEPIVPPVVRAPVDYAPKQIPIQKSGALTLTMIEEGLRQQNADSKSTESTTKQNLSNAKSLKRILNIGNDWRNAFNNYAAVIQSMNNAKMESGKEYAPNSRQTFLALIAKLLDNKFLHFNADAETRKQFKDQYQSRKQALKTDLVEKNAKEDVPHYTDYLNRVEKKFGKDSKEFLVASIYKEVGARDNLQLERVNSIDDTKDGHKNYIVIPPAGKVTIVLNNYKTQGKFKTLQYTLTESLSALVRAYCKENKVKQNEYLIGDSKLSQFISNFGSQLNYPKGEPFAVNKLRKMGTSTELYEYKKKYGKEPPADIRAELANRFAHSIEAQKLNYEFNIRPGTAPGEQAVQVPKKPVPVAARAAKAADQPPPLVIQQPRVKRAAPPPPPAPMARPQRNAKLPPRYRYDD